MTATVTLHPWSSDALFNKTLVYVGEMEKLSTHDWQFAFWSSLSLELLARAALANVSPTLLADGKEWRNVHYALGHPPTKKDFIPKSAVTNDILRILNEILPEFGKEFVDFCSLHCANRNAELHSGENRFAALKTSEWLPKYYATCEVLLNSMGKNLDDLFDDPKTASEMISTLKDTAAKAVAKDIEICKNNWNSRTPEEQLRLIAQATAWATRFTGHRADCPACGSPSLIKGTGWGPVSTTIDDDSGLIIQKQTMIPASFECVACGLKIAGLSRLAASGLAEPFKDTTTSSAAEYFNLHTDEELEEARAVAEPEFEEDMNER